MRKLSEGFMSDLIKPDGKLHTLLERIKQDHTLMLAIRKDYINIYYRGGNLLKVERSGGIYRTNESALNKYANENSKQPPPDQICNVEDSNKWVAYFQKLKRDMDYYFSTKKEQPEREFQQLLARENNFSTISKQSEYFVTDIEFTHPDKKPRIDILTLKWPADQRINTDALRPALIEMKYGENALKGESGLIKHLKDIDEFINDKDSYQKLIETMEVQFNQLNQLDLLKFKKIEDWRDIKIPSDAKPEVICILANQNPRSEILDKILKDPWLDKFDCSHVKFDPSVPYNLRFHVSSFAGYALHTANMVGLRDFKKILVGLK